MDGNESLASAVIALNASQKIAINPVCPDKERILTAATHFYQEHKYREYLENAIKHNADFFWSLVESVLAKIDEKTRKKYITGLQQSPGIIVSRMINALIAEKDIHWEKVTLEHFPILFHFWTPKHSLPNVQHLMKKKKILFLTPLFEKMENKKPPPFRFVPPEPPHHSKIWESHFPTMNVP
jgi:hypothetical protein